LYVSIYVKKFSLGKPPDPIQRGGEGKERGEGKEGEERRGRGEGSIPQIKFYDYSIEIDNSDKLKHTS
jgi:hypothetical protein